MEPAPNRLTLPARLGEVVEVGRWFTPTGEELRVVRWVLTRDARCLLDWARGDDLDPVPVDEWIGGVSLDKRELGARRWSTMRRQELVHADRSHLEARLSGWEHGLVARARQLAAMRG